MANITTQINALIARIGKKHLSVITIYLAINTGLFILSHLLKYHYYYSLVLKNNYINRKVFSYVGRNLLGHNLTNFFIKGGLIFLYVLVFYVVMLVLVKIIAAVINIRKSEFFGLLLSTIFMFGSSVLFFKYAQFFKLHFYVYYKIAYFLPTNILYHPNAVYFISCFVMNIYLGRHLFLLLMKGNVK